MKDHIARMLAMTLIGTVCGLGLAEERTERFDKDPGWEGRNNRSKTPEKRIVRQDFGHSPTANAGCKRGEIGGFISPAAETAYYGRKLETKTFNDSLSASGTLMVQGPAGHLLVGFFNSRTVNEWRTPNTIALRILGRGDHFFAYVEYTTAKWRAGGDSPGGFATVKNTATGRLDPRGFKCGVPHKWSLKYDPAGNKGGGSVTVTLNDETAICHLDEGHKADGARFDRFGLLPVLKSADGGGEVWFDDVAINGTADDFTIDPKWEGVGNRRKYETADVRPRFDFGFSASQYAGGEFGELGGNIFRGDCRYEDRLAAYGVAVEGPSRDGFLFYPAFRTRGDAQGYANSANRPHILPDGASHEWWMKYDPKGGKIVVALDGKETAVEVPAEHRRAGARFDRFGLVTTWIDGNAQRIYFDDLTYTCAP
jgi:hypothetical protein